MKTLKEIKKKIILLGDAAVGKTSLIRKFVLDKFDDKYLVTVGFKITTKDLQIAYDRRTHYLKFHIWDILGQKGYIELHKSSLPGTAGVIFVADVTRKSTLESIDNYWIPNVQNIIGKIPFIFLANKSDLVENAEFNEKDLKAFASRYEVPSYLTSAKSGENVNRAFNVLGKRILKFKEAERPKPSEPLKLEYKRSAVIEVLDKIIDDFCKEFGRYDDAMPILRHQFELANVNFNSPTIEALRMAIDRLAKVETGYREIEIVEAHRKKRLRWAKEIETG